MENEISMLGKEINRMERLEAIDKEMGMPTSMPITSEPEKSKVDNKTGRASDEYKKAFWNVTRNPRTATAINALQEGVDSEGGYLVPDEFERTLIKSLESTVVNRDKSITFKFYNGKVITECSFEC